MSDFDRTVEFGPIHPYLPGAMKLSLDLCGDQIVASRTELGYLSKNIETLVLGKSYEKARWYFSRVEPESAMILDRLFSEAFESATQVSIDGRAIWIREITTLISELMGTLKYLSRMAEVLGLVIEKHVLLKHREELLDLVELLTGSRYGYYFIVLGGTRYDLTEGFIERLEKWIKKYKNDFARIEAMLLWTHPFQNRLKLLGRVIDEGSFGFVSEASVETTRYGQVSQVESRLCYALRQTSEGVDELFKMMKENVQGKHLTAGSEKIEKKQVMVELLTGRGTWRLELGVNSTGKIESMKTSSPSDEIMKALPFALDGEQVDDVPVILQSLNFLIAEIDR